MFSLVNMQLFGLYLQHAIRTSACLRKLVEPVECSTDKADTMKIKTIENDNKQVLVNRIGP